MTDPRTAWADVGDRLSALCLKIKLHAEEELSDDDVREQAGLDRLRAALEETLDAVGDTFRDDAVRSDVKEVGRAFVEAIEATVRDARERFSSS